MLIFSTMKIKYFISNHPTTAILIILFLIGYSSCKKPGYTFEDFDAANIALINVWNNEDMPPLKFSLDTSNPLHNGNVNFGRQLGYQVVYAGNRTLKFNYSDDGSSVFEKAMNLESKKIYSLFLTGTKDSPELVSVEDDVANEPPAGKYRIRIANMVTDAGAKYALYAAKVGETIDDAQMLVNPTPVKTVSDFAEYSSNVNPEQRFRLWAVDSGRDTLLFDNILFSGQKAYTYTIGGGKDEGQKSTSIYSFVNVLPF